jgi:Co/Zn/Cd efflux system component
MQSDYLRNEDSRLYLLSLYLISACTLGLFLAETIYGITTGSRYLIKDGVEWIYDIVVFGLAAISYRHGEPWKRRAAFILAAIILLGGIQTLYEFWQEFSHPTHESIETLELSAAITIAGSIAEAALMFRFRQSHDPLVEGTWLYARNSALTSSVGAISDMIILAYGFETIKLAVNAFGVFLSLQAAFAVIRDLRK